MDFTAPAIQTQPAPANAGTKHLTWSIRKRTGTIDGGLPRRCTAPAPRERWEAGQTSSEFRLSITRMWSWLQTSFLQCAYWSRKLTSVRVCVQPAPSGGFCRYELHSSFSLARSLMASATTTATPSGRWRRWRDCTVSGRRPSAPRSRGGPTRASTHPSRAPAPHE
jgi:hypothetical protein